jgi:hypothetical protein
MFIFHSRRAAYWRNLCKLGRTTRSHVSEEDNILVSDEINSTLANSHVPSWNNPVITKLNSRR